MVPLSSALVGVVVGGIIGRNNEKTRRINELRKDIVLDSLDQAYAFEDALSTFITHAPFGSTDPEDDLKTAQALERTFDLQSEMRRMQGRVSVIGSQRLIDAFANFQIATDDYMNEVARQINADGIFRAAEAKKFLALYAGSLDNYVNEARQLLQIKRKVKAHHHRNFDAVQVNDSSDRGADESEAA